MEPHTSGSETTTIFECLGLKKKPKFEILLKYFEVSKACKRISKTKSLLVSLLKLTFRPRQVWFNFNIFT